MTINTSGKWDVGSEPADINTYLIRFVKAEGGYPIDAFRLAKCHCGSLEFNVEADGNEGCAKRTCIKCSKEHLICDSSEYWEDAEPELCSCTECKSTKYNIGVGFSFRNSKKSIASLFFRKKEIKWIYIGIRCSKCGILGCCADWKIDYGPSAQLMDQV